MIIITQILLFAIETVTYGLDNYRHTSPRRTDTCRWRHRLYMCRHFRKDCCRKEHSLKNRKKHTTLNGRVFLGLKLLFSISILKVIQYTVKVFRS